MPPEVEPADVKQKTVSLHVLQGLDARVCPGKEFGLVERSQLTRHCLVGIKVEGSIRAIGLLDAILALRNQSNVHVVLLMGQQNGEGVEEAHLGFAATHRFNRGGFAGTNFDLVGQTGHLAEAVGHRLAALGDLAQHPPMGRR